MFSFQVNVVSGEARREFSMETDGCWEDFRRRVVGYLENGSVKLAYKIFGDAGKPTLLETVDDYTQAMERIVQKARVARTRAVSMDVKNIVSIGQMNMVTRTYLLPYQAKPSANLKKRSRQDDIPPALDGKDNSTQHKAYNQLERATQCEAHRGHCFIDRVNGLDNHRRLDHAQMTLWAKKIVSLLNSENQESA